MLDQSNAPYDLFISHADADQDWVEGYLLDALTQTGMRCTSEAAFALGAPRLTEFERAVQESQRTLLVLSPAYLADGFNQLISVLAQSYDLQNASWSVIPLILHPVKLPPRLAMLNGLDATEPDRWRGSIERLCTELRRQLPAPMPRPRCPYPGMAPFKEADSDRFFGRDEEVGEMLEHLRLHPFLAVIGPSGSGKSSLVFAGLIPALRKSGLFGDGDWLVRTLRPGQSPDAALAAALNDESLVNPARSVSQVLASRPTTRRLLLVVDQFEELFAVTHRDTVPFQQNLLGLAQTPNCFVVLTVRADFYRDLMTTLLWRTIQAHRYELLSLNMNGLRQAIVKAANRVDVFLEGELVECLLRDAGGEPGVLPLLQETLVLLWERLERRYLPRRAYEAIVPSRHAARAPGRANMTGLQVAIARRADQMLSVLTIKQQRIARRVFLRLVQFGEGRADTRRQQSVAELRSDGDDPRLLDETVRYLADRRLLTLSGEEQSAERNVDLAHEQLIDGWPQLRIWIDERHEAELTRRRLEAKAAEWQRLGGRVGGLLDEVELADAEGWLAGTDAPELGYNEQVRRLVVASRDELKRSRQRELGQAHALADEQRRRAEAEHSRAAEEQARREVEEQARRDAERRLAESQRLRCISLAQALAAQAPRQHDNRQDERGALLARQAYLLNQRYQGAAQDQIDGALRATLSVPAFGAVLPVEEGSSCALAFSPDSRTLAVGDHKSGGIGLWHIWEPDAHSTLLPGPEQFVHALAFSPDGARLAAAYADGVLRIWDVRYPSSALAVLPHPEGVNAVAFSPDSRVLASGCADGCVRLWSLGAIEGEPVAQFRHRDGVMALAFSPDARSLASGGEDGTVCLWDVRHPQRKPLILAVRDYVSATVFAADGQHLIVGTINRRIYIWPVSPSPQGDTRPRALPTVVRTQDSVHALTISPDGRTLAVGAEHGEVHLREISHPRTITATLRDAKETRTTSLAFSPDGAVLASCSAGGLDDFVRVWDLRKPDTGPRMLQGHQQGWINAVAISHDGYTIATGSRDRTVCLWDLRRNRVDPVARFEMDLMIMAAAFSPDGHLLAVGQFDGIVRVWDMQRLSVEPLMWRFPATIFSLAFVPGSQRIALGLGTPQGYNGSVVVIDPSLPLMPAQVFANTQGSIISVVCHHDGRTIAGGSPDGLVYLWDLDASNAPPKVVRTVDTSVNAVAFSPDGRMLVAGCIDGTLRFWHIDQGLVTAAVLRYREAAVRAVAFSSDSEHVAAGYSDGSIRTWLARTDPLADLVCHRVWRNLTYEEWLEYVGPDIPYECTCPNLPPHPSFVAVGRELARAGNTVEAFVHYERVAALARDLTIDAKSEVALGIADRARDLARAGDVEGALQAFQEALALHPHVVADPRTAVAAGLVDCGQQLANDGQVDRALAALHRAVELDPELKLDPRAEIAQRAVDTLLAQGRQRAVDGAIDDALERFRKAAAMDPAKAPVPEVEAARWLVLAGEYLARTGALDAATERLRQARDLDPALAIDPRGQAERVAARQAVEEGRHAAEAGDEARAFAQLRRALTLDTTLDLVPGHETARGLCEYARRLARMGDADAALAQFRRAQELYGDLALDPKREVAHGLVEFGEELAGQGQYEEAVPMLRRAAALDRSLRLRPRSLADRCAASHLIISVIRLSQERRIGEALDAYQRARELDPKKALGSYPLKLLCRYGVLEGRAADVAEVCERAAELAPQDDDSRFYRGVVRALAEDYAGAAEDLRYVQASDHAELGATLRDFGLAQWIDRLSKGENPFDEVTLAKLREEDQVS